MVEWIEIANEYRKLIELEVSTLVVEWIEILETGHMYKYKVSPPSWWSGLK